MEGLWAMRFSTEEGGGPIGAGVIYVRDGKAWGGDNGYYWTGEITLEAGGVRGELDVRRYMKNVAPLFEGLENPEAYTLEIRGGFDPKFFWAGCKVIGQEHLTCSVEINKV